MSLPVHAMNASSFPEMYERWLVGPLFRPWAEVLLDRARPVPGERVLDVACGTGVVARLARERQHGDGQVVGVDVSPQMLAVARANAPQIDWREGSAEALPLDAAERFDLVLCQQGLQFFPDRPAAAREWKRALRRGGRLAVAVWRSLEQTPFFRDLYRVAERRLGPFVDRRHAFGDPAALERLLVEAGLEDVRVETVTLTMRLADPSTFVRLNSMALVGMSGGASSRSDEERAGLADLVAGDSVEALRPYADGAGLSFELGANVATALG